MGKGSSAVQRQSSQLGPSSSGLGGIFNRFRRPSAQQQSSQFGPSGGVTMDMVPQRPQYQQLNPYAAPFQQSYVQQFYPAPAQFVPQSAENYRSPFAEGMGGKGGRGERTYFDLTRGTTPPAASAAPAAPVASAAPDPYYSYDVGGGAAGGVVKAAAGRYLQGLGDGTSDSIPAMIGNSQPARLADGEFVIDARTVSEIGNGSSNAGAKKLYAMMERVHRERKKAKRGQNTNADRFLPK